MRSVACSVVALVACVSCGAPVPDGGGSDEVPLPPRAGASQGGQTSGKGGASTDSAPLPTPPDPGGPPSPPSICSTTKARYCVDFESAMTMDWSTFTYSGQAPTMVSDTNAPSPKLALDTTVPPQLGSWTQVARLVGVTSSVLKIELDLDVAAHLAYPDQGYGLPLEIRTPPTADNQNGKQLVAYYFTKNGDRLYVSPNGDTDDGNFKGTFYTPTASLPATWTHVVLEIGFDRTKGHVTLSFNGTVVLDRQNISTSSTTGAAGGAVTAYFGVYQYTNSSSEAGLPGLHARYDNVQIF